MPSSPLMSANDQRNLDGVPQWQPDDQVTQCPLCHHQFSLFYRRHHCRRCGRVVCGNCSLVKTTYLPSSYVVGPPSQIFLETPHIPHRTCDECAEELEMIRAALRSVFSAPDYRNARSTNDNIIVRGSSSSLRFSNISARTNIPHHNSLPSNRPRDTDNSVIIRAPPRPVDAINISSSDGYGASSSSGTRNDTLLLNTSSRSKDTSHINTIDQQYGSVDERALKTNRNNSETTNSQTPKSESLPNSGTPLPHKSRPSSSMRFNNGNQSEQQNGSMPPRIHTCPVCNRQFDVLMTEDEREDHITNCLKAAEFSGSPEQLHRPNRMVIYNLPEKEAKALDECVICLENFNAGDSVGRLECFCVYHKQCILDWFARKGAGECPVHAVNV